MSAADYLANVSRKLSRARVVKVGFLEGATYPDGDTTVATVAAIQNYGAPAQGIPPRPFFTNMIADKQGAWGDQLAAILEANDHDVEASLDKLGAGIAGQLREAIQTLTDPPLSEKTIKAKGFAKPLVDTGHMLNSVSHEVEA